MKAKRRIKFVCHAARWFDKVNGNSYHSVRITRCRDGKTIACGMQYGYGDCYRQTALAAMLATKWIPKEHGKRNENGSTDLYLYERNSGYPIEWIVSDGLKRDCISNGTLSA